MDIMETLGPGTQLLEKKENQHLTCEELLRTELNGKFLAVERYDAILWKIRSGYVVVLYGALALMGADNLNVSSNFGNTLFLTIVIVLMWGFGISGFLIDMGFLLSKLRVVLASNELYTLALQISLGNLTCAEASDQLKSLLQNSGESLQSVPASVMWNTLRWLIPLYFGTPVIGTIIFLIATP
jgi:hypothetical protein